MRTRRRDVLRTAVAGAALGAVAAVVARDEVRSIVKRPDAILRVGLPLVAAALLATFVLPRLVRRPRLADALVAVATIALAVLITLPHVVDRTANEQLAGVSLMTPAPSVPAATPTPTRPVATPRMPTATPVGMRAPSTPASAPGPRVLRTARFAGIDHRASGMAGLVRLADGRVILRFEDLDVDNAPDMHVHILRGRDKEEPDGGRYLGKLKANRGDQNYDVPADVDISGDVTALIWCRAFAVPIANATLRA